MVKSLYKCFNLHHLNFLLFILVSIVRFSVQSFFLFSSLFGILGTLANGFIDF